MPNSQTEKPIFRPNLPIIILNQSLPGMAILISRNPPSPFSKIQFTFRVIEHISIFLWTEERKEDIRTPSWNWPAASSSSSKWIKDCII
ncbi:hypothetical protein CEXT_774741 [Caerostris extrusa]|uniref:Uncharacterized protein n=1 Tax=Caerostris extrusa TaxID=172846 RepID=A0AAV4VLI0_CAEEX|nr:hypothetical protein CEXT_774741 [Caerostris extrusa]